ncbi:MAG: dephospho-CoA kinase [Candidatus Margulisbacteria bacterium]|jgi:dephospho-CoA kinase|nr:dephospho-CoA kinase [Candidatus Margulisiibacteriota bacterium]
MIIGLTGPAAAGKNEVARCLKRSGALVIDADKVAHELYAAQTPVWHELVKAFGSRILMRGGRVDRKKLGEIVFADRKKLQLLNKIVHPALKESIERRTLNVEHKGMIVINAAVLKEIGLVPLVDQVWVVTAPRATRLKRLIKRGSSRGEALRLLSSQPSLRSYLLLADRVIRNEGTLTQLYAGIRANL